MLLAKTSQYSLVAKWSSKRSDSRNSGRPDTPSQLAVRSPSHDPSPARIKWMQDRVARVGWKIPTVEVRYQNLTIETQAQVASRSLPTLINVARNMVESWLDVMGIRVTKKITFAILKGVSGIIKPGRMTLLLGPPSSGKTTLLLALAGRLAKNLKKSGEITYNGYELGEFMPQKTSSYIRQYDLHEAQMTVRETLTFSARCQGVGERCDPWTELVRRENELGIHVPDPDVGFVMDDTDTKDESNGTLPDYVLKILGLDVCADTLVGDQMRRGISGGEKKRVTTGEMIIGPTTTLFMDEISTGLDTSTTFQIIKWLANVTRIFSYTTLISLLQPAPETYNLFDDIILLSEGQVVYHGPRESILEFFEACGFKCPERKGVADFLQEVTAKKDQEQYWADKSKPYQFTTVNDFIEAYKTFRAGETMVGELTVPFDKASSHPAALTFARYSVSTKELFIAVFAKEWLLMRRNTFVNVFKAAQIALVALICMSVFFSRSNMRINNLEDPQIFAGALFYGVVSIMFNGFSELPMTIMRLPVFYKLRDFYFFPPWAFTVSRFILSLPVSLLESSIWIIFTYYTIGFAPAPDRFFRQLLVLFWVHQMSSALFRFIAGLCRTIIRSNTGGSLALLLVFIMSGFLIPRTSIKPWWIWGYWVSPLAYAQNAIEVNEFLAPRWKPHSLGVKYLLISGLFARGYWYWLCIGVMIGYTILFNVGLTFVLTVLGPEGGPQTMVEAENEEESIKQLTEPGSKTPPSNAAVKGLTNTPNLTRSISASLNARSSRYVMGDGATGEPRRGMVLPFQPLAISFSDVNYYVDLPKGMKAQKAKTKDNKLQLLRGITGAFRPGVLTALVGVSGAGKSTLLDVLAGRKTRGYIEGDIRIAGFPKKQATFIRVSGYCEQNDVHSPRVTVHESLTYSAWLRLPADIDQETKRMFVLEVMDLVELTPVRNRIVGLPGMNGLSTEQRKRLTIAVELVANPSIIFMDEPTSGLDARAAAIVMRTVRNTVDTGRTVVCTIHQPSIDIFEAFDELLLLKQGGQVIYAGPLGPHSHKLIQYFEAIPGVPKIPEGYNPATWMLEISSAGVEHRIQVNFGDRYENSALFKQTKAMVQELSSDPAPDARDLWFPTHYSQPLFSQFHACLWKHNLTYWRSPDYNSVRFIFTSASGLFVGTIFWQFGKNLPEQGHLVSIMGAIFCGAFFMGIRNSATVQPIVATERTVFYRESAAGLYSAIPYAIAQVTIELPYCFVQTILYCVTTYPMMALQWTAAKFLWYMFFNFFNFVCFTFYGMMVVGLTPNQSIAAIVGAFFYSMFNLFGGFVIKRPDIPVWWIWYYWICPVAWTVYGLVASQFGDLDNIELKFGTQTNTTVAFGPQINTTVAGFVDRVFGFKHSFLPVVAVMVVIFPVLFATVFMFSIKFVNFQKR